MLETAPSLLCTPVPLPSAGDSVRLQKGHLELVLERVRGGWMLLCHDGHEGRRHFLGLPSDGALTIVARAPLYPLAIHLRDSVTLAPGGRLRAYLLVPIAHQLVWTDPGGEPETLVEWLPRELQAEWVGGEVCVQHADSPLFTWSGAPRSQANVLVPVVLRNCGDCGVTPGELPMRVRDEELRERRGRVVAAPRWIVFDGTGEPVERVRGWGCAEVSA